MIGRGHAACSRAQRADRASFHGADCLAAGRRAPSRSHLPDETPGFQSDLKLRSQLDDAADSVCRNVAEGFGCKSDREFARFVRVGRRSLNEVQDCFLTALHKGYVTQEDLTAARRLHRRLYPAIASLLRSLNRDTT
ncbi:MAG TPA: four helix bundle protein [Vicinamibacterales bacterium]|nr:four helix bundle protein [Vicinamibacterales bacterium]